MIVIDDKRDLIYDVCMRFVVSRMNVFGSALRADFRPGERVIDLLVQFTPIKPADLANSCFIILELLSSILNIPVDLAMSYAAKNSYIAAGTHWTNQVLYVLRSASVSI